MKTISPTLLALLQNSLSYYMADLFTFTLSDGTILRYTSAGVDIHFDNTVWYSGQGLVSRGNSTLTVGIRVDTINVDILANANIMINGVPIVKAANQGVFDGAKLLLKRLFLSNWVTPVEAVILFSGNVSQVDCYRGNIQMSISSFVEKLNINMPQNVYQSTCAHTLYDAGCSVNRASFLVHSHATSQNSDGSINTALTQASNYFNMGSVTFTSGQNSGEVRTVKLYTNSGGTITFPYPLANPVSGGDTFDIIPGCDKKRLGDCTNKYTNTINFQGFEFIPVPETAA